MLTTRDLGLREIQAEKNINETYTQMRRQPVGGRGALLEKANAPVIRQRFVPTVFVPSPAVSSLPYLDDRVKMRSNENVLMLEANIARQREVRKATIESDVKKVAELNNRIDETLAIKDQFAPSDRELMRRFLGDQILKRKQEAQVIEDARRARVDLDLNPTRVNPTVEPIRTTSAFEPIRATELVTPRLPPSPINAEDLGQSADERLRGLATSADQSARRSVIPELKNVAKEMITKRLNDALKDYPRKLLRDILDSAKQKGYKVTEGKQLQTRPEYIEQIVNAKRLGYDIPLQLPAPKMSQPVARAEPFRNAGGGGTVGGGGFLNALKGQIE